jgi:hypothetical protein
VPINQCFGRSTQFFKLKSSSMETQSCCNMIIKNIVLRYIFLVYLLCIRTRCHLLESHLLASTSLPSCIKKHNASSLENQRKIVSGYVLYSRALRHQKILLSLVVMTRPCHLGVSPIDGRDPGSIPGEEAFFFGGILPASEKQTTFIVVTRRMDTERDVKVKE